MLASPDVHIYIQGITYIIENSLKLFMIARVLLGLGLNAGSPAGGRMPFCSRSYFLFIFIFIYLKQESTVYNRYRKYINALKKSVCQLFHKLRAEKSINEVLSYPLI